MNGRAEGFPADHCPKHHTASAACLLSTMYPGAMCSPSKDPRCYRAHDCYFQQWTAASMSASTGLQQHSHVHNKLMDCVFWHLSIRTSMNLTYSLRSARASMSHAFSIIIGLSLTQSHTKSILKGRFVIPGYLLQDRGQYFSTSSGQDSDKDCPSVL